MIPLVLENLSELGINGSVYVMPTVLERVFKIAFFAVDTFVVFSRSCTPTIHKTYYGGLFSFLYAVSKVRLTACRLCAMNQLPMPPLYQRVLWYDCFCSQTCAAAFRAWRYCLNCAAEKVGSITTMPRRTHVLLRKLTILCDGICFQAVAGPSVLPPLGNDAVRVVSGSLPRSLIGASSAQLVQRRLHHLNATMVSAVYYM